MIRHNRRQFFGLAGCLLASGLLTASTGWAQAAAPAADPAQARAQVYGWQLMTPAERQALQTRIRNADSAEERARIRSEHHAQMQARARERGVTLPDMPAARGPGGFGRGPGAGPATGSRGKGQGPGR